jgi:hypothetical protein
MSAILITVLLLFGVTLAARRRRRHSLLYATYLRSPLWRLRRRLWILQAHGRCENCRRHRRLLTIHHRTYTRLGHERRSDIDVLCWGCHRRIHRAGRSPRQTRTSR